MLIEIFSLCDAATVDKPSDKMNLLGVFDSVGAKKFPAKHRRCCIALRIRMSSVEAGKHPLKIGFADADGSSIGIDVNGELELRRMPPGRTNMAVNMVVPLDNLPLPKPGSYSIDLSIDNRPMASLPLDAVQVK